MTRSMVFGVVAQGTARRWIVALFAFGASCAWLYQQHDLPREQPFGHAARDTAIRGDDASPVASRAHWPSGELPELNCDQARAILDTVQQRLPYKAAAPTEAEFAEELSIWVDPTATWIRTESVERSLSATSSLLLRSLRRDAQPCPTGLPLAVALHDALAPSASSDGPKLPEDIRLGVAPYLQAFPDERDALTAHLQRTLFPSLTSASWDRVVLAAAVRALVRLSDMHSEWAPPNEESDATGQRLLKSGPEPLWDEVEGTPLGVRIHRSAHAELSDGDEIIWVQTAHKPRVYLAGISPEQCEQISLFAADQDDAVHLRIRRATSGEFDTLSLASTPAPKAGVRLQTFAIQSDAGAIPVLRIEEMYDELGDDIYAWLDATPALQQAPLVVLDLRGNGGGAVEPTLDVLSLWLGDRPMLAWTASTEAGEVVVEGAPASPTRWEIPAIVLIDAETASAAEMLAGALQSYGYARVVGEPSYGKGCMQENVPLPEGVPGILSLTTALYALPTGQGVQRAGVHPDVRYNFGRPKSGDREAQSLHVAPRWSTRDVRPLHSAKRWSPRRPIGQLAHCTDEPLCEAIRRGLK